MLLDSFVYTEPKIETIVIIIIIVIFLCNAVWLYVNCNYWYIQVDFYMGFVFGCLLWFGLSCKRSCYFDSYHYWLRNIITELAFVLQKICWFCLLIFNNEFTCDDFLLISIMWIVDSENGKFSYGYASSPGKRSSMEDFYETRIDGVEGEIVGLFGVFDGLSLSLSLSLSHTHTNNKACKT